MGIIYRIKGLKLINSMPLKGTKRLRLKCFSFALIGFEQSLNIFHRLPPSHMRHFDDNFD